MNRCVSKHIEYQVNTITERSQLGLYTSNRLVQGLRRQQGSVEAIRFQLKHRTLPSLIIGVKANS